MTRFASFAAAISGLTLIAAPVAAQSDAKTIEGTLTLFEGQTFDKRSYRVIKDTPSLPHDFLVGSIAIFPGETWEACDQARYRGNCLTLTADESNIGKAVIKSVRMVKPAE